MVEVAFYFKACDWRSHSEFEPRNVHIWVVDGVVQTTFGDAYRPAMLHVIPFLITCRGYRTNHSYREFSNVVADGQFSTLGTVLVAVLARLAKATGIDRDLKTQAQAEKKNIKLIDPGKNAIKEDAGVPIRRSDDIQNLPMRTEVRLSDRTANKVDDNVQKGAQATVNVEAKQPKKKKKKKNAIDDLFAGVL